MLSRACIDVLVSDGLVTSFDNICKRLMVLLLPLEKAGTWHSAQVNVDPLRF